METILNIVIGLTTGMISGILSGMLVTKYYRKKDEEVREKEQHEQAISLAVDFFEDLQIEISKAKESMNCDYSAILKILERKQRYLDGLIKGKYAVELSAYSDLMKKILNIELKLKNNTWDFKKDDKEFQDLLLRAFRILF